MPAKLDRCVDKVMMKGHDKSSAFAICNKSLGLSKVAITMKYKPLLKAIEKLKLHKYLADSKIEDLNRTKQLYGYLLPKEEQIFKAVSRSSKSSHANFARAMNMKDRIGIMNDTRKTYGTYSPSLLARAKKMFMSRKPNIKIPQPSAEGAPAFAYARK